MAFNLFGFSIQKTKEEKEKKAAESFVAQTNTDGALTVEGAGAYGTYIDLDGTVKDEFELITRYREMSLYPECDYAIDDIVNEAIVLDGQSEAIQLDLSELDLDDNIKDKILQKFVKVKKLIHWKNDAYEVFRKWYVDGRLYYHVILPDDKTDTSGKLVKNVKDGILEVRYIDPRQIRKIRVAQRIRNPKGIEILEVIEEYFIYNQRGIKYQGSSTITPMQAQTVEGVKISPDSVIYVHSGIVDKFSSTILSNLHKAIKPCNQLKMMEDALVIYRIVRAPERRIFYIDIGNLPKSKGEDYLRTVAERYRQRQLYDINTGEARDDRRFLTMMEDYWLPVKDGASNTKIDTLPGGENLDQMADVEYFEKKLYKSLNVPISRMDSSSGFILGRSQEITRDEIKFAKLIHRLRNRFAQLFLKLLEMELVLTNIMTTDEWEEYKDNIKFKYANDNHYAEVVENEVLKGRLELLSKVDPDATVYSKKYVSVEWIRKHILKQTEDEQKLLDKEIAKEKGKYDDLLPELEEPKSNNFDDFHGLNDKKPKPTPAKKKQ